MALTLGSPVSPLAALLGLPAVTPAHRTSLLQLWVCDPWRNGAWFSRFQKRNSLDRFMAALR